MRLDIVTDHIFYYNQKFEGFDNNNVDGNFLAISSVHCIYAWKLIKAKRVVKITAIAQFLVN